MTKEFLIERIKKEATMDNGRLDEIFGIFPLRTEPRIDYSALKARYGQEQYLYEGLHYRVVSEMLRILNLGRETVFYDLGSGYGRILFWAALFTPAQCRGIEIVPERVAAAQKI